MYEDRLDKQKLDAIAKEQAHNVLQDNYNNESVEQLLRRAVRRGYYAYHNLHVIGSDVGSIRAE